MGAKTGWLALIFLFLALSGFNAFDGFMRSGLPQAASGRFISQEISSLLMLPAVVLHFVLLLRRGTAKS